MTPEELAEELRVTAKPHEYCSVDCPCGHWPAGRYATTRPDGRRGKPNLDIIEENRDAAC